MRLHDSAHPIHSVRFAGPSVGIRAAGLLVLILLLVGIAAPAAAQPQDAGGFLYVLRQDSTANGGSQIYGYRVNPTTGALTGLAGFPVATGGEGMVGGGVSEGLFFDRPNRRLYALNSTSRTVSAFAIDSISGALTALPFSPISLGPEPSLETVQCLAVHPSGSPLLVASRYVENDDVTRNGRVYSFKITNISATAGAGSPYGTGSNAEPLSCEFSRSGDYFYTGGWSQTRFAGFAVNTNTGVLDPLSGSPFLSGGDSSGAFATDDSGRLFSADVEGDVRVFTTSGGIPALASSTPSGLDTTWDGLLHPAGFYIVAAAFDDGLGVYRISGSGGATTLTAVSGSPFAAPGGTAPLSLALDRTGTLLFVAHLDSRNLATFRVNTTTGALTGLETQPVDTLGATGDVSGAAFVPLPSAFDFDGDVHADVGIYRPSIGTWHILRSSSNSTTYDTYSWGVSTDIPVAADYDGDGKADIAVYRPSTGVWLILQSSFGTFVSYAWGQSTDTPVPADYDGDGKADVAVYRPSTGDWLILHSTTGYTTYSSYAWGASTDRAVPDDYDGDGKADIAVFRPSTGGWHILQSSTAYTTFASYSWGASTDTPVPADYDGDGRAEIAIYRPSTGDWLILHSTTSYTTYTTHSWGVSTDRVVPADYDGDGKTDIAVYRPSTGGWFILQSSTAYTTFGSVMWGTSSDIPIPRP